MGHFDPSALGVKCRQFLVDPFSEYDRLRGDTTIVFVGALYNAHENQAAIRRFDNPGPAAIARNSPLAITAIIKTRTRCPLLFSLQ